MLFALGDQQPIYAQKYRRLSVTFTSSWRWPISDTRRRPSASTILSVLLHHGRYVPAEDSGHGGLGIFTQSTYKVTHRVASGAYYGRRPGDEAREET